MPLYLKTVYVFGNINNLVKRVAGHKAACLATHGCDYDGYVHIICSRT